MMRVSDYVFQTLKKLDIGHIFTLSGGGIMYLLDSLGRSGLEYVCCHHEQAAAIAAQAYSMYQDLPCVCLVTTGPGGTNALTGTAAAYVDSTPMLFLSGQVKRADFARLRNVRQFGAQENDIISMAKPVTKYATLLESPEDVAFELEKCLYIATHGRKGPVWLDIPLDVQSSEIDETKLRHFTPEDVKAEKTTNRKTWEEAVSQTIDLLKAARRPLLLVGQGMVSAGAQPLVHQFVEKTGIPVMATWRALDFMGTEEPGFLGSPGLQAPRYSNLILQHCDFLLVLGSRLDNMITAFNEQNFACRAKKVVVDVDENEIAKLKMPQTLGVTADVKDFMNVLLMKVNELGSSFDVNFSDWVHHCQVIKEKFPIYREKQDVSGGVNLYRVTEDISKWAQPEDTIVISSTSRCNTAGHIAFSHKRGQKTISSMGMGAMGFALPSAVGAYFANGKKRVIVIEGDGSLQLNLQEFETIVSNDVEAKIFLFDNRGYAAITTMQDRNFGGFYVGSNDRSGVTMPDFAKVAAAYGIPVVHIHSDEEIAGGVQRTMLSKGPCLCIMHGSLTFDEIPRCISMIDEKTGQRVSAALENPYPFLSDKEMEEVSRVLLG